MSAPLSAGDLFLAMAAGLSAGGGLVYLAYRARSREARFGLLDALILAVTMAIGCAAAVLVVDAFSREAEASALAQNLHVLRSRIALYRAEHNNRPPLLYQGSFPQLTQATDAEGRPGPKGPKHPFGPYLPGGVPPNPCTGCSVVTPTATFPPEKASGNGGWLYHRATGQVAADLDGYLAR